MEWERERISGRKKREHPLRKLQIYVDKYGPVAGPKLYHALQSQAAHAGVSARLRRKIEAIRERGARPLPLFDRPARSAGALAEDQPVNPDGALPEPRVGP